MFLLVGAQLNRWLPVLIQMAEQRPPNQSTLNVHGSPCVVLVINDNLYGLMFALSYT